MNEWLENLIDTIFALGVLVIFAMAIGQVIDNQAARLDPASPYATKDFRK